MELLLLALWSPAILYGFIKIVVTIGKMNEYAEHAKRIKL